MKLSLSTGNTFARMPLRFTCSALAVVCALALGPATAAHASPPTRTSEAGATQNCGIATCSVYFSRSTTKKAYDFLDKYDWQLDLAAVPVCGVLSGTAGAGAPAVGFACDASKTWVEEEIERAVEDHPPKGACLKMTYTPSNPPVVTYWSTNNGKYCKD